MRKTGQTGRFVCGGFRLTARRRRPAPRRGKPMARQAKPAVKRSKQAVRHASPTVARGKRKVRRGNPAARRGRPRRADPEEVLGTAEHFRTVLGHCGVWAQVADALWRAKTEADVLGAFSAVPGHYAEHFTIGTMPKLLLTTLRDRDFPKVRVDAQIAFVADSLAATGDVSPRRSRQVCREERKKRDADPERYHAESEDRRRRMIFGDEGAAWRSTVLGDTRRG